MTTTNRFLTSLIFVVLCATLTAFLASCKTYDIKPGSERIRVFETEPRGCIFLGEIPAEQEDSVVGPAPAEIEMSLPTRIEMRNKAFSLNANVIVFANKNKAVGTAPTDAKGAAKPATPQAAPASSTTTNPADLEERKIKTVFLATVFRCPPNIVNQ